MPANLRNSLAINQPTGVDPAKTDDTFPLLLPTTWYNSPDTYELERRAIFSRKWLLTTHKLQLPNTGNYFQSDVTGFPLILCKDREGNINAFHNVCRHRAFPVVTEQKGTARIFSCKYHGWSYGLNGKLAKAPGYQDLAGFDKTQNGLFPIHVHVDEHGFVWLNLDAAESPEFAWEDEFNSLDLRSELQEFNFEGYDFDHSWKTDGAFNWKILAEHYHKIYQGQPVYLNDTLVGNIYCFLNITLTISPHAFFIQRVLPNSPSSCSIQFEVYRCKSSNVEDFELITSLYKHIVSEDKALCIAAQKDLITGISANGKLPSFQRALWDLAINHLKREEEVGRQIWPSRQVLPAQASTSKDDIDFCARITAKDQSSVDCSNRSGGCCGGSCAQAGNDETLAY